MKKFLAVICIVAMTMCLFASCSDDTAETNSDGNTPEVVSNTDAAIKFTVDEIGEPSVKTPTTAVSGDIRVISLKLDNDTVMAQIGKKGTITATVKPDTAKDPSIYWESSAEDIVKVDKDGNFVGIKPGAATITATTNDGGYSKTCKVVVYQNPGNAEKSDALFAKLNDYRKENSLSELAADQEIQACANQRAYEEALDGKMDNTRPNGDADNTIFKDYDVWTRNSRCIATVWGNYTADQVYDIIIKDEEKASVLKSADTYNRMSVGYYEANGVTYWIIIVAAV